MHTMNTWFWHKNWVWQNVTPCPQGSGSQGTTRGDGPQDSAVGATSDAGDPLPILSPRRTWLQLAAPWLELTRRQWCIPPSHRWEQRPPCRTTTMSLRSSWGALASRHWSWSPFPRHWTWPILHCTTECAACAPLGVGWARGGAVAPQGMGLHA
jgi:hypothetical protein